MITRTAICIFLFLIIAKLDAQESRLIPNPVRNVPRWVRKEFAARDLEKQYTIIYTLYPYVLKGDFNGDGRRDCAIQVEERSSGKDGIAIVHGKRTQSLVTFISIIGAGKSVDRLGDDLKWANVWEKLQRRQAAGQNLPQLKCDAIRLAKREGNNGIIYWDGKKYSWKELPGAPLKQ